MHRLLLAGFLALGIAAHADVPRTIGFQGRLAGANGTPKPDGAYPVRFALYNLPEGTFSVSEYHTFTGNTITLDHHPVVASSESVASWDGAINYRRDAAYTIDYASGAITRANATVIPDATTVLVSYQFTSQTFWEETKSITLRGGAFNTALGDTVPIPEIAWTVPTYIGVSVGTDPEMTPRQPILGVAYAQAVRGLKVLGGGNFGPNITLGSFTNTIDPALQGASIGGGARNQVSNIYGTVSGGSHNIAGGDYGAIGGGRDNVTGTYESTVGGGRANQATGGASAVGGGYANVASGGNATIPGGVFNEASGDYSFAAGLAAKARESGSFVWADGIGAELASNGANTFSARASGGFRLYTNNAGAGARLLPNEGSWSSLSDRNAKEDIAPIDSRAILDRLTGVPMQTWRYRNSPIRHIGPMAQDFAAAFQVGEDDRHISAVDADGVALAAVQALYRIVQEKDTELAALRARLDRLENAQNEQVSSGARR